jgi:hypothetical protein
MNRTKLWLRFLWTIILVGTLLAVGVLGATERTPIACPNCPCQKQNWQTCAKMCERHTWTDEELVRCDHECWPSCERVR